MRPFLTGQQTLNLTQRRTALEWLVWEVERWGQTLQLV